VTDKQRHVFLSWEIIKHKLLYYAPHKKYLSKFKSISDDEYDAMEREYLTLCRKLNVPNTVVHKEYPGFEDIDYSQAMMEVDVNRRSVQCVQDKLFGREP